MILKRDSLSSYATLVERVADFSTRTGLLLYLVGEGGTLEAISNF